jgi:hypothetical protein
MPKQPVASLSYKTMVALLNDPRNPGNLQGTKHPISSLSLNILGGL